MVGQLQSLDKKLVRDLWHIRGQAAAIALVIACGVATVVMAFGMMRSLEVSQTTYYDRQLFAHVFSGLKRGPATLRAELNEIEGVSAVDLRIVEATLAHVPGAERPATLQLISLPKAEGEGLNRPLLRKGRFPRASQIDEALVSEAFAEAHGLELNSEISINLNGKRRAMRLVGMALSPEFIYAISPGQLMPDDEIFGVLWLSGDAMEAAFDMEHAFNDVSLRLTRGANKDAVIEAVDRILAPYGGLRAYGREDQLSDRFIESELDQLRTMGRILPFIFLGVAAFLLHFVISRLLDTEREEIGLMKAFGYSGLAISWHYLKLVGAICLVGGLGGIVLGVWMGRNIAHIYGTFFHFPYLFYELNSSVVALALASAFAAAGGGAWVALVRSLSLPPAVAMRPPAPPVFRRSITEILGVANLLPPAARMIARNIERWPFRAGSTSIAIGASVALMLMSFSMIDSVKLMVNVFYYQFQRGDAMLSFSADRSLSAENAMRRLPGVLNAEGFRAAPVSISNGSYTERTSVLGLREDAKLVQLLKEDLAPQPIPSRGIAMSIALAESLNVGLGDHVHVRALDGWRREASLPVRALVEEYVGTSAYMSRPALDDFLGGPRAVSGAYLQLDRDKEAELFNAIDETPAIAGISTRGSAVEKFQETFQQSIYISIIFYVGFGAAITIGVVYNAVRISLAERARELATLRVLGFTKQETATILLGESTVLVLAAMPIGCVFGYGFSYFMSQRFSSELFRIPFVLSWSSYAWAIMVGLVAALATGILVGRRVAQLDLVSVLKARD